MSLKKFNCLTGDVFCFPVKSFVSVCAQQAASFKFGHTRESAGTFVMSQIILVGPPLEISQHREKSSPADECENSFQVSNAAHTSLYTVKLKYSTERNKKKTYFCLEGDFKTFLKNIRRLDFNLFSTRSHGRRQSPST